MNTSSSPPFAARSTPHNAQLTAHWVPESPNRGTFRLLISCILTLFLCVWTSLHLNIPRKAESVVRRFTRKLRWTLLAVFAPELVVYAAWRQWMGAKTLCEEVNRTLGEKAMQVNDRWTIVHGFYAVMGGFVIDINLTAKPYLFGTPLRLTLTSNGVLLLAKLGLLPSISDAAIIDKSKADPLAKLLVCAQATWCLLQYLGRLGSLLPVTLLETNTVAHAICALVIYLIWWSKPLDIREPTAISGDQLHPLCAFMWMCSRISGPELEYGEQAMHVVIHRDFEGDHFNKMKSLRWKLAAEAIERYPEETTVRPIPLRPDERAPLLAEYLVERAADWPGPELLPTRNLSEFSLAIALAFASAAYGDLHATAWNGFFPTWQERCLWRASSLVIACTGVVLSLAATGFKYSRGFSNVFDQLLSCKSVYWAVMLGYTCCRVFLVLGAFISIREVPVEVYRTPVWSQLLPHM